MSVAVNQVVFTTGGTVQAGGGTYLPRRADGDLLALCRQSQFAYVLTARQMGKSSLMVRTVEQLAQQNVRAVMIDLTQIGTQVTPEQWYLGLLAIIEEQLDLDTNAVAWWQANAHLGFTQRLTNFFQQVLLKEVTEPVVIFVDEIDTTLNLAFTDDFYAAIRYLYNARATTPEFKRLSFVLIGVTTPSDLIRDPQRTPFNIGQRVDLTEFTRDEVLLLASGLGVPLIESEQILDWILKWTNGHPFLTQQICRKIVDQQHLHWSERDVIALIEKTYFGPNWEDNDNLQFVRDMLTKRASDQDRTLTIYGYVREGRIRDEGQDIVKSHLKLSGIVRSRNGLLVISNEIYKRVFDEQWIFKQKVADADEFKFRDNKTEKTSSPLSLSNDVNLVSSRVEAHRIIFTTGGVVQAGGGTYLSRRADDELLQLCLQGDFSHILTARQTGKSSLMVRTVERLAKENVRAVMIDLTQIGTRVTPEQWYLALLAIIEEQLNLATDAVAWWQANTHLGLTQRLTNFLQEVVLREINEPIVIFIDEIDTTLSLDFTDDFFAAIRSYYNARATTPAFKRLSFVLIGVATPGDLIRDPQRTPFNIGQRIDLTDFTLDEALPLAYGLTLPPAQAEQVLSWVMDWTSGHPYLTQRLCQALIDENRSEWSETDVQRVVALTFFGAMSEQENNLSFVRDMLTRRAPDVEAVLTTYQAIRSSKHPVRDEEQSIIKSHLKLSGVVKRVGAELLVRNRIYETVFDERWVRNHLPTNWRKRFKYAAASLLAAFLISFPVISVYTVKNKQLAAKNKELERALAETRQVRDEALKIQESEARTRDDLMKLVRRLPPRALTPEERARYLHEPQSKRTPTTLR